MGYELTLAGRVALITGAGRGIGREIAIAFAQAGAAVVLAARHVDELESAATACRRAASADDVTFMRADVTNGNERAELISHAVECYGRIDVLVNNAGAQNVKPFLEFTDEEVRGLFEVNFMSALALTRLAGERMIENGSGSIINMSSIYAHVGAPGASVYCATKGALSAVTRALAVEWARHGVRVNCICPGWVETDLIRGYLPDEATVEAAKRQIPLRRFAAPSEIAPLAVYLASEESSYITGQDFVIDGGQTAR